MAVLSKTRGQVHPLVPILRRKIALERRVMKLMREHIETHQCLNTQRELMATQERVRHYRERIAKLLADH